jgi:hypothetical protein
MTYRKLTHLRVTGITTPMFQAGSKVSNLVNKAKIVNIPITTDEQAMFDTTQAIYDINGSLSVTARTSINITEPNTPPDNHLSQGIKSLAEKPAQSKTITAFDVVVNNADMQLAINKITDWHSDFFGAFATDLRAGLANLSTFAGKVIPVSPITITDIIIFPDNSSILVRWNYALQSYEYIPGSAKDGAGNPIPVNHQEVTGNASYKEYVFPATTDGLLAGISQIDNLNRMGVSVKLPAGVPIDGAFVLACTNTGSGPVCTIVTNRGY